MIYQRGYGLAIRLDFTGQSVLHLDWMLELLDDVSNLFLIQTLRYGVNDWSGIWADLLDLFYLIHFTFHLLDIWIVGKLIQEIQHRLGVSLYMVLIDLL